MSGNATDTITYRCSRCDEIVTLTLNAKSKPYDGESYDPRYDCTLDNVDAFNEAMQTHLFTNNIKLYENGSEIARAADAGAYTARIYVDETHYAECAFEITPQELVVSLDDFTKEYGQPDPDFKAGLSLPDDELNSIVITREPGENVGTYKLSASAPGNANYTVKTKSSIVWSDGRTYPQLTIGKRRIKVSGITAQDKVYDGTTAAELNTEGATLEDLLEADEGMVAVAATGSFADADAGTSKTVDVAPSLEGRAARNYSATGSGSQQVTTASISKRPLIIKAQDQVIDFGQTIRLGPDLVDIEATPDSSAEPLEASGLVDGQHLGAVTLTANEAAGTITPSEAEIHADGDAADAPANHAGNYSISYQDGKFTVTSFATRPEGTSWEYDGKEHRPHLQRQASGAHGTCNRAGRRRRVHRYGLGCPDERGHLHRNS